MHVRRQSHQQFSLSSGLWTRALMVLPAVTLLAQEPVGNPEPGWSTVLAVGEPTARHEAAMVAVGGKGYLMGGRGIKPVEEFNPATSSWRQLGPTPFEMHHFQPVEIGGLVYVVTAMTGKYPKETPLDAWHTYDPAQDLWKEGGPIPAARRRGGAGTVAYRGKIYVAGGIVDGHTSGTVPWFDEFDPETGEWQTLPDAPRSRDHFPAVVTEGRVYLIGGRNTSYHEPGNFTAFFGAVIPEVDVYDFATGEWSTLAEPLQVPSAAGGLAVLNGSIYYFGGESDRRIAHSETHRIDPMTGAVDLVAPLRRGRHGGGAAVLDGMIFVAAGSGGRGGGPELSSTEVFAPER